METEIASGVTIDWTVSLGSLIQLIGFICGGLIFGMVLKADVRVLAVRVTNIELVLASNNRLIDIVAKQEERLASHTERLLRVEQAVLIPLNTLSTVSPRVARRSKG